ncbi:hypothetical protein NSP_44890 [Nodularia spumigena CCY9414]|nr:hypothetical protein NSP_44890 [Nodularia spumigena CCY9414]
MEVKSICIKLQIGKMLRLNKFLSISTKKMIYQLFGILS